MWQGPPAALGGEGVCFGKGLGEEGQLGVPRPKRESPWVDTATSRNSQFPSRSCLSLWGPRSEVPQLSRKGVQAPPSRSAVCG